MKFAWIHIEPSRSKVSWHGFHWTQRWAPFGEKSLLWINYNYGAQWCTIHPHVLACGRPSSARRKQGLVRCCKSHESRHHYHHLIIMIVLIEEHHKASSFIAIIGWLVGWLAISQAANYSKWLTVNLMEDLLENILENLLRNLLERTYWGLFPSISFSVHIRRLEGALCGCSIVDFASYDPLGSHLLCGSPNSGSQLWQ